ncbi:ABC transporter related protein [Caldicellulosiruptor saccharolyticus DSM 8903]|uniref:ABC transporter related protein n=1 Tax=Caldicellulosiruptor saccharolyticus (strain ATCC 43494 / DSM 8903 / Tp8T 6331) TaxID=351627 RepID=A4XLW7_CALS8|nr:ABC transporter ATP-binding protein [Caldicellulosiruptor saccharolyticus]ABP67902.1 ABC transporter related protein [Caldicellulosiruptor saccharolyticus DSM 8903]
MEYILEVRGISKRFGNILANDNVNLDVKKGEVHAILGENGAGKSTLMNIIYGLYEPDFGEIYFEGQKLEVKGPHEAIEKGIGMVHQHFMLIPVFTVAENIVLGFEPKGFKFNVQEAEKKILEISKKYNLEIDPKAKVGDLSVGMQQRVEILKAFYKDARLLILDEPTAMLTPQETRELFKIINNLKAQGISILFISHKLDEVMEISDRVTVMRRGKTIKTLNTKETNEQELANLMVGREVKLVVEKNEPQLGETVLKVENLSVKLKSGIEKVKDVSFEIRKGEIFGIAGVDGNGQNELVEAIVGLIPSTGKIIFNGQEIQNLPTRKRYEKGIAYIPADRQQDGLVLNFTVAENIVLKRYYKKPYSNKGFLNYKAIISEADKLIHEFDVRPPDFRLFAKNLSGGNQQKVILAREFSSSPDLLIAVQPTRGMDVGAIEYIHRKLIELRDSGKAILLVSLELDEILNLSDRIAVMYSGRIMDILDSKTATKEDIGLLMTGKKKKEA